jgi:hypothetical protein
MNSKSEEIKNAIKELIIALMDRVMNRVLVEDPFLVDEHHAKKPLYAALVPDEIFKGSHFERRFVTPFGGVWEKLAKIAGEHGLGYSNINFRITGTISKERLRRINEVLNNLEHPEKGVKRIKPDWDAELKYILAGKGELIPTTVICDVYAEDKISKKKYAFEIKSPLPNSDITKVSKEKILKLYCMEPKQLDDAFFALPYNLYGKRENYNWGFPQRWFDMKKDKVVLIGNEFWDFLGGKGTYQAFINEINKLGQEYRLRIYKEFLFIEPPKDNKQLVL